jgi:hypothetical protein
MACNQRRRINMTPNAAWTREETSILERLDTPWRVQEYLDSIPYNSDHQTRSPRRVLRDGRAHCMEGALFAAAALRFHGHPPLLVNLRAENDDDHVLAIYRWRGFIGAVAKSNFVGLRFREPIHRTLRELALSYFEPYFNTLGDKSLRAYSRAFDLGAFDSTGWMTTEDDLECIGHRLDRVRHYPLLDEAMIENLSPMDQRSYEAGMQGSDPAGLFQAVSKAAR